MEMLFFFFFEMLFTLLSHLIFLPVIFQSLSHVCDPMNYSMPSFPVLHSPGVCSNSVHRVSDAIQPSHPLSSPSPFAFNLSQHQSLFQRISSCFRWLKYWSFSFSISPSNEYSGLISFRIDWCDLLAVQGNAQMKP